MGARDIRLDAVRGLALGMIFVDHIGGNPLARYTLGAFGFADAAEVFVLVAGTSAAHAYGRRLARDGYRAAAGAVLRRVRTVYAVHLLLFALVGAIAFGAALRLGDPTYLEAFAFDALGANPLGAASRAVALGFLPPLLDVLPLYVVLLSALLVLLPLSRLHAALPLALAAALYAAAQVWPLNLPNYAASSVWYFNPAAWGLLFVIGLTAAGRTAALAALPGARLVTVLAALVVLGAAAVAAPWRVLPGLADLVLVPQGLVPAVSKTDLGPLRLADILAKAWLVAVLVPATGRLALSWPSRALAVAGRHSLPVFAAGIVLSVVGTVIVRELPGEAALAAVNLGGLALLAALAAALDARRRARVPAKSTPAKVDLDGARAEGVTSGS